MTSSSSAGAGGNYFLPMEQVADAVISEFGDRISAERFAWSSAEKRTPFWIGYRFTPHNPFGATVEVFLDTGIRITSVPNLDVEDWSLDDVDGASAFIGRIGRLGIVYTRTRFPWGRLTAIVPEDESHREALSRRRGRPSRHYCPW
jgi:hypothetical protein